MHVHSTHATLLEKLAAGSQTQAWVEFCDRYGELIKSFAKRQSVQPNDCDDVLQDVLVELAKEMPEFRYDPARGRFRGYLKTITLHAIYKRFRRKGDRMRPEELHNEVAAASNATDIDGTWEAEWRQHHVRLAMKTIEVEFNDADRMAFQHYAVQGHDVKQTAATLGLTPEQVYQAKSRIARRLGELIEQQVSEEG